MGENSYKMHIPANAPEAFHLLAKPTGAICNLDCAYCFFLDKELLYPDSKFRMSDELLERYIRQLIESHQVDQVTIAWQGGEPTLMGLDFYQQSNGSGREIPPSRYDLFAYHANQWHHARRRVVRLLQGTQFPHRHQHRRAAGTA